MTPIFLLIPVVLAAESSVKQFFFFISPFGFKLLTGGGKKTNDSAVYNRFLFLSEKEKSRGSRIATRRFFIEIHRTTNAHESAAILDFFFFVSYYHDPDKTVFSVEAPEEPVQLNRISFFTPKAGIMIQEKKKS